MSLYTLEKTFQASDGAKLFYRHSDLTHPRRVIVIHGLTEHTGCYPPLISKVFPDGDVSWVALDFRGHGYSAGKRNQADPERYANDVTDLLRHIGWDDGTVIGLGHSFGSLLALYLAMKNPKLFKALILSAPFFDTPDLSSRFEAYSYLALSILFPGSRFYENILYNRLTHDKNLIRNYKNDSLIKRRFPLDVLKRISQIQKEVKEFRTLDIPTLVLMGQKEKIVSKKAIIRWLKNCQSSRVESKFFKGFYHEVLNELNNEKVIEEIQLFLNKYHL